MQASVEVYCWYQELRDSFLSQTYANCKKNVLRLFFGSKAMQRRLAYTITNN